MPTYNEQMAWICINSALDGIQDCIRDLTAFGRHDDDAAVLDLLVASRDIERGLNEVRGFMLQQRQQAQRNAVRNRGR